MSLSRTAFGVPEDLGSLVIIPEGWNESEIELVMDSLQRDLVVLIQNVRADEADSAIRHVADGLALQGSLEVQAAFAGFLGHRSNVGKYFMTVNKRSDYQFIPPHSEGGSSSRIQLASFFCFENTTDGGENILMQVDDQGAAWSALRERVRRTKPGGQIRGTDIARARALHKIDPSDDALMPDDRILRERQTNIAGLTILDVLAKTKRSYSTILRCETHVYWDSTASIDRDSAVEYVRLLRADHLLREPEGGEKSIQEMDIANPQRIWQSGVAYCELFKRKITRKLSPGDLLVFNNMTWTHSAANWTPNSGRRRLAAAFA